MLTREEVSDLFTELIEVHDLQVSDLLVLGELCIVEAAARQSVHPQNVRKVIEAILDEQGVKCATRS